MKIDIKRLLLSMIYIFICLSAVSYLQFCLTRDSFWMNIRYNSNYIVVILAIIYLMVQNYYHKELIYLIILGYVAFAVCASIMNSLFLFLPIVQDLFQWPLVFLAFYRYARTNTITNSMKKIMVIGAIIVMLVAIPNSLVGYSKETGTALFSAYYSITFIPIVYMVKNKKLSLVCSCIVTLMMCATTKRGAFLAIVIGIFLYYISANVISDSLATAKKLLKLLIVVIVIVSIGFYIIDRMNLEVIQRLMLLKGDGGSGRIRIWECVYDQFKESSFMKKLFGHGFHAVSLKVRPLGVARFAHNSFLEIMYDYGVLGLCTLLVFMSRIVIDAFRMLKHKFVLAPEMIYTIAPTLVFGCSSYFFEQSVIIVPFCVVWGICMGTYRRERDLLDSETN